MPGPPTKEDRGRGCGALMGDPQGPRLMQGQKEGGEEDGGLGLVA